MARYPRPEARPRSLDVWREINPPPELVGLILADMRRRVEGGWPEEPQSVPFPAKYLRERRWQERYTPKPTVQGLSARSLEGLPCFKTCSGCGEVVDGIQRGGQKDFAPCSCVRANAGARGV
jgi:hypothetical protein